MSIAVSVARFLRASLTRLRSGPPRTWTDLYVAVTIVLFAAYLVVIYVQQMYLNEAISPYQLFFPYDALSTVHQYQVAPYTFGVHFFGDYQLVVLEARQGSPYLTHVVQQANYPPLLFVVLKVWAKIPYRVGFALFMAATTTACLAPLGLWLASKNLACKIRDIVVIGFFSLPVLVTLDRANFEGLAIGLVTAGVWAYTRQRYWLCAVCFAAAGSIKFYLIAFAILLLSERRWREALGSVGTWAAGTFGGLLLFSGGYGSNLHEMVYNVRLFAGLDLNFHTAEFFNRSIYGLFVVVHYWMTGNTNLSGFFIVHYAVLSFIAAGIMLCASLSPKYLKLWQRVLLICVALTALPELASGYTYLSLLIPVALYLREETPSWQFLAYGLPLALVLLPKGIGIDAVVGDEITWLNVVDPGLLALIGIALVLECAHNAEVLHRPLQRLRLAKQQA